MNRTIFVVFSLLATILPNNALHGQDLIEQVKRLRQELKETRAELAQLRNASAKRWYKVQIHTQRGGGGGTDGNVFLSFAGTRGRSLWLKADSPGDSHEQLDMDFYYFITDELGDNVRHSVYINGQPGRDDWGYSMWLFELQDNKWVEKLVVTTSKRARDATDPPHIKMNASCHDGVGEEPKRAGRGPAGHDLCRITRSDDFDTRTKTFDTGPAPLEYDSDFRLLDASLEETKLKETTEKEYKR